MGAITKFEEIESWQKARKVSGQIWNLFQETGLRDDLPLQRQMNSSSGSTMDNIAEGFERGSNKEFIQFLFYAKGSSGELRSQLIRCYDRNHIDKAEFEQLKNQLVNISRSISGFINYLKSSQKQGYKFNEDEIQYLLEQAVEFLSPLAL